MADQDENSISSSDAIRLLELESELFQKMHEQLQELKVEFDQRIHSLQMTQQRITEVNAKLQVSNARIQELREMINAH